MLLIIIAVNHSTFVPCKHKPDLECPNRPLYACVVMGPEISITKHLYSCKHDQPCMTSVMTWNFKPIFIEYKKHYKKGWNAYTSDYLLRPGKNHPTVSYSLDVEIGINVYNMVWNVYDMCLRILICMIIYCIQSNFKQLCKCTIIQLYNFCYLSNLYYEM